MFVCLFDPHSYVCRRVLDDVHVLTLTTMTWRTLTPSGTAPFARSEHVATAWGAHRVVFFGGTGPHFKCHNAVHVLDLERDAWVAVTPTGTPPSPRAGHAGATVVRGRYWCLVGGGNNVTGVVDSAVLDLETMAWIDPGGLFPPPPVVGEGMSLCAVGGGGSGGGGGDRPTYEGLVACGGYNGACFSDVHVYRVPTASFPTGGSGGHIDGRASGTHPVASASVAAASAAASASASASKNKPPTPMTTEEENAVLRADARRVIEANTALAGKVEATDRARLAAEAALREERLKNGELRDELRRAFTSADRLMDVERECAALREHVAALEASQEAAASKNRGFLW